ncbi:MAG: nicotinate phosphoribosyltransferase [Candidatus Bathyarchaeota archaeon]|nr:MAG: nicotinate phosphoribosyltransferase [Candidatus Bathyarchaeota archaeon]
MPIFHIASDEEIKKGETTDIYFVRTKQVLEAKGLEKTSAVAEVTSGNLPENWSWSILCGIEELALLFKNIPVDVYSMPEGTAFYSTDIQGFHEPVMRIEGSYGAFCIYETALLGLICQASGIATRAARLRKIAEKKQLISFGIRRMHPSLSPMIDRAAFIGGFDAVSCLAGARSTQTEPVGTMPHALIVVLGDQIKAWKAFDDIVEKDVPRVALVDTYSDEKTEAILAAETLKNLRAVRLDTPLSRKGNFAEIVREVRWELNLRGYEQVKIFVSGGLNEGTIKQLSKAGADAFGVGTYVCNSPAINFALDIVQIKGKLCAKRGKLGGKKEVWRCQECLTDIVLPYYKPQPKCPKCRSRTERMLKPTIKKGKIVAKLPKPKEIRRFVMKQLDKLPLD